VECPREVRPISLYKRHPGHNISYNKAFCLRQQNHRCDQEQQGSGTHAEGPCSGELSKRVAHDVPSGQMQSHGHM